MTNAIQSLGKKAHEAKVNGFTCETGEPREAVIVHAAGFHKAAEKSAHRVQRVSNPALQIGYRGHAFMGQLCVTKGNWEVERSKGKRGFIFNSSILTNAGFN